MVKVRIATVSDAPAILAIYAPYILTTAISFETVVPSTDEFRQRMEKGLQRFPWLVCEVDEQLAGYVYASPHREREAYQWTCECSVYLHQQFRGKRMGRTLYTVLFELLKYQGFRNLYAGITLPNEASVMLHEKCGFKFFDLYENIGYKLGSWQNVGWWKLSLSDHNLQPPPPLKFSEMDQSRFAELFHAAARQIQTSLID